VARAVLRLVNEDYDPHLPLKEAISTYVTLGYSDVKVKLENGVFLWNNVDTRLNPGDYKIYDEYFEEPLL
jgi:hypothetical protein